MAKRIRDYADKLRVLKDHGGVIRQAEKNSPYNFAELRKAYHHAVEKGVEFETRIAEVSRLRRQVSTLERRIKDTEQKDLDFGEVRETIMGLSHEPIPVPQWVIDPGKANDDTAGVPTLLTSDWHAGEVVEAAEVNFMNQFNSRILEKRVRRIVVKTAELATVHIHNGMKTPGIIVPTLGDQLTGEIHPELEQTNDMDVLPSIPWLVGLHVSYYRTLADIFGRVFVPACAGNHGRTTKRIQAKKFTAKNFDWLVLAFVERELKSIGDDRIIIHFPVSNDPLWSVYGKRFLGLHGHDLGVKGGDGIIGSLGPIKRGRIKVGTQAQQMGRDFDVLTIGHWHQYIPMGDVIVNNTLKGFDEYAATMLRATPSTPSQALFYTHPKYGITSHWQVFAEEPKNTDSTEWLSWKIS